MKHNFESSIDKNTGNSRKLTQNQGDKNFLKKAGSDLWNSRDLYISGEIKDRSNYSVLTDQGEIEDVDGEKIAHLEVSVEDMGTRTMVPGLEIEAVLKQDGEKVEGPIELPFLFSPDKAVYMAEIEVESGSYDVLVRIFNEESGEKLEIEFEQLSYGS